MRSEANTARWVAGEFAGEGGQFLADGAVDFGAGLWFPFCATTLEIWRAVLGAWKSCRSGLAHRISIAGFGAVLFGPSVPGGLAVLSHLPSPTVRQSGDR
jgi:hypothetical protein